jgi:glycosyltransferase involved in cell wall biosynthesis
MKGKLSVIMAVHNDELYLEKAILSVLGQSFKDFVFIIIDDGSIDRTSEIICHYSLQDDRIVHVKLANGGQTNALIHGISLCNTEFIARMDSDDVSLPDRLMKQFEYLCNNADVGLIGGRYLIIDSNDELIGYSEVDQDCFDLSLQKKNIFCHADVMFRTELYHRVGGYRKSFLNAQDYDLWLRLSEVTKIHLLNDYTTKWRLNPKGLTLGKNSLQNFELKVIKKMALRRRMNIDDEYDNYNPGTFVYVQSNTNVYNYYYYSIKLRSNLMNKERLVLLKVASATRDMRLFIYFLLSFLHPKIIRLVTSKF